MNNFRGDVSDISAKTEILVLTIMMVACKAVAMAMPVHSPSIPMPPQNARTEDRPTPMPTYVIRLILAPSAWRPVPRSTPDMEQFIQSPINSRPMILRQPMRRSTFLESGASCGKKMCAIVRPETRRMTWKIANAAKVTKRALCDAIRAARALPEPASSDFVFKIK